MATLTDQVKTVVDALNKEYNKGIDETFDKYGREAALRCHEMCQAQNLDAAITLILKSDVSPGTVAAIRHEIRKAEKTHEAPWHTHFEYNTLNDLLMFIEHRE